MRRQVSLPVFALTVITFAAVGAIAASLILLPATPRSLVPPSKSTAVPVTEAEFADERPAEFSIQAAPQARVSAPRGGVITAWSCAVNGTFAGELSGVAIDGVPLLTVITGTPLWRDIRLGDSGKDVRGLQAFMNEQGAELKVDGIADSSLIEALAERASTAGQPDWRPGVVPRASLLWVPEGTARVSECVGALGQSVMENEPLAMMNGGIEKLVQLNRPDGLPPGKRVALISGEVFTLDEDGAIAGPDELIALVSTPEYHEAVSEGTGVVHATTALAEPMKVSVVPPSTLFGTEGANACIANTEGASIHVRIVGSSLGRTYVVPSSEEKLPLKVLARPKDGRACR